MRVVHVYIITLAVVLAVIHGTEQAHRGSSSAYPCRGQSCIDSKNYQQGIRNWFKGIGSKFLHCAKRREQKYPQKNDRIAIIGAGAAGIHMAYSLQKLGYTDITIFEKRNKVGGKSYTYHHKGTRHEMGTVYTTVEYTELFKLLNEFKTGSRISAGSVTRWINPYEYFLGNYPLYVIATEYGITGTKKASAFLMDAVQKYIRLHKSFFSNYEGDLFPRPSAEVLQKTKGTFMEFLERNNITVLKTLFISMQTVQGYGHLDEIAALYGLMWNTPKFIMSIVAPNGRGAGVIDKGYQPLWKEMVNKEKLKVIFNANILSIKRSSSKVTIRYNNFNDYCLFNQMKTNEFDFLILAADIKDLIDKNTLRYSSFQERKIFRKAKYTFFTTSLIDSDYGRRGPTPTNYLMDKAYSKIDHVVWANMDSYCLINNLTGPDYFNGVYPGNPSNEYIQSAVYYQIGKSRPSRLVLDTELANFTNTFDISNYTIIKSITWKYFPRYSPEDMTSGILWDILDMQGYKKTWYIGASVCFESIKSVLEYNKLLLRKFNLLK